MFSLCVWLNLKAVYKFGPSGKKKLSFKEDDFKYGVLYLKSSSLAGLNCFDVCYCILQIPKACRTSYLVAEQKIPVSRQSLFKNLIKILIV
jgi:hypothetical protein